MSAQLPAVSLFSGVGGLDLAVETAVDGRTSPLQVKVVALE